MNEELGPLHPKSGFGAPNPKVSRHQPSCATPQACGRRFQGAGATPHPVQGGAQVRHGRIEVARVRVQTGDRPFDVCDAS